MLYLRNLLRRKILPTRENKTRKYKLLAKPPEFVRCVSSDACRMPGIAMVADDEWCHINSTSFFVAFSVPLSQIHTHKFVSSSTPSGGLFMLNDSFKHHRFLEGVVGLVNQSIFFYKFCTTFLRILEPCTGEAHKEAQSSVKRRWNGLRKSVLRQDEASREKELFTTSNYLRRWILESFA